MKKMYRILSLLLVCCMTFTNANLSVLAVDVPEDSEIAQTEIIEDQTESGDFVSAEPASVEKESVEDEITDLEEENIELTYINPLYADVIQSISKDEEQAAASDVTRRVISESDCLHSFDGVVRELRKQLVLRNETINIYYMPEGNLTEEKLSRMVEEALVHTGNPKEGDYLLFQYGGCSISANFMGIPYGAYRLEFNNIYFTNASQEAAVDNSVRSLIRNLNLNGKTDFEKVRSIYDYICKNVTYDFQHVSTPTYDLMYTAYGALVNKTAVCQGYAVLFYRLMLEIGVDCRIISGKGDGAPHAWNIVRLDGKYFNVDSTWDAQSYIYGYFLKCDKDFLNHKRDKEYNTTAFHKEYPMANYNYMDDEKPSELPFTDVSTRKWYYNAVKWAYTEGYLTGTSDTTFSPNDPMTRGMLVTVLYRMEGRPNVSGSTSFPDVKEDKYYAKAVCWAANEGLVSGYQDGNFGPEDSITREQLVKVLFQYSKYKGHYMGSRTSIDGFKDANEVSSYAVRYMEWAVREGFIEGSGGELNPKGNATRAEISAILKRFVEKHKTTFIK